MTPSEGARAPQGQGDFGRRGPLQLAESTLAFRVTQAKPEFGGQRAGSGWQDRCVCEMLCIRKAHKGLKYPHFLGMRQLKSE